MICAIRGNIIDLASLHRYRFTKCWREKWPCYIGCAILIPPLRPGHGFREMQAPHCFLGVDDAQVTQWIQQHFHHLHPSGAAACIYFRALLGMRSVGLYPFRKRYITAMKSPDISPLVISMKQGELTHDNGTNVLVSEELTGDRYHFVDWFCDFCLVLCLENTM
jgi:hypothetical protein